MFRTYMQYSQLGQGEYLHKLATHVCPQTKTVVEIGAHSPHKLSNSRCFLENGYVGYLVEANHKYCNEWHHFISDKCLDATIVNQVIEYHPDSLDILFSNTFDLTDIGVLFLDIDGSEYLLLEGMRQYRPKLICVEYDNSYPLNIEYIPTSPGHGRRYQASSLSMFQLMKSKDYLYLASFYQDHIFIEKNAYEDFINNSSIDLPAGDLHFYQNASKHLFSYDGALVNQADGSGDAGINFFASKVQNLVSNGQIAEAKQYYSHLVLVFRSYHNIVKFAKSPSYSNQYSEAMNKFIDKYTRLFYSF